MELKVGQIQGISPTFQVELDKNSALEVAGKVRFNGTQKYQPLPVSKYRNYFATRYNPIDPFTGGPEDQVAWGTGANAATMSADPTALASPVGGVPLKMAVTGGDPYTNTYNSAAWNITEAQIGDVWTFSVYVRADQVTTGELFLFESTDTGSYTVFNVESIDITTAWTRVSTTRTFTGTTTKRVQVRVDGPNTGGSGVNIWWSGFQLERGNTASEFTASPNPVVNPDTEDGMIQWDPVDDTLRLRKNDAWVNTAGDVYQTSSAAYFPQGSVGNGGGFTVAEGANNTAHKLYTSVGMPILAEGMRYNDGASGDETMGATSNLRAFLDYISSTSGADFAFHTGHSNPGNVSWPQYLAVNVSQYKYGKVLNRIKWYKHQNAIGNVNVWGSNQIITRSNFTDTASNWTYLDRLHFGGSGSGSEGGELSRTFSNTNGYRWYMIEMVDINSTALTYPNVGSQGGWAMYGMTIEKA